MDAKEILAAIPANEPVEFALPSGAVLKVQGIRSFAAMREAAAQVQLRKDMPSNTLSPDALWAVETFTRGVVEPKFTRGQAVEFSERDGITFFDVVKRINELSATAMSDAVTEAKDEIASDPPCAR